MSERRSSAASSFNDKILDKEEETNRKDADAEDHHLEPTTSQSSAPAAAAAGKEQLKDGDNDNSEDEVSIKDSNDKEFRGDIKKEKIRVMKNILIISIAFLCNFTAYNGLSRLQSSLHRDEGMGTATQSVLYAALVVSCMFIPKLMIYGLGHKWTITISFSGYIIWMAANGYAVWATMIPASILVGLCAAPLWTAQCSYFTIIAGHYARITGEKEEATVTRFFGIFFMFFQLSSIIGSIISSTVLMPPVQNASNSTQYELCGANDCPWYNISSEEDQPSEATVWTMVGIYIGIACLAVILVATLVENLPKFLISEKGEVKAEIVSGLVATFRHLRHTKQWIIVPLTMYSGFEQAAFNAEWTRSFVTCGFGMWKVGLVTLPFGAVNAIVSLTFGHVAKYTGRAPIFILGMIVDLCIQFTMMFWIPNPNEEYVLYILSSLWGLTDGIWQTQINALYGCLFADESEAAFSNYRMWESLGFIIAFAYSNFICTSTKIYILTSVLVVGMIGYFIVEFMHQRDLKRVGQQEKMATESEMSEQQQQQQGDKTPPISNSNNNNNNNNAFDNNNTDEKNIIFRRSSFYNILQISQILLISVTVRRMYNRAVCSTWKIICVQLFIIKHSNLYDIAFFIKLTVTSTLSVISLESGA